MGLLQDWQAIAFNEKADRGQLQNFWSRYFAIEKSVYEKLLSNPDEAVEGTVKELAERFEIEVMAMVGFLDGIDESLVTPNNLEDLTEDSHVSLAFDKEKLYKNMVEAKADWLYELPQWKEIFSEEKLKQLYTEQKKSGTVVKETKVYPNDPCPCGSGKKYKKCCVKELAERFEIEVMAMVGFLDGIDESLVTPNNLEDLTEDSHVSLAFDKEKLYKNMVEAKADWLYELPQWKEIFSEEKLKQLYTEQKKSGTVVKETKVYPNDPCPCGSGKKYKKCCGRNK